MKKISLYLKNFCKILTSKNINLKMVIREIIVKWEKNLCPGRTLLIFLQILTYSYKEFELHVTTV